MLRSRYRVDKAGIAGAFTALLESSDVEFEDAPTVEEALTFGPSIRLPTFADCLLTARAAHLGRSRFLTFDASAARLPGVELLA